MASRLRKALIQTTSILTDNAGSFVNVTAVDLHIRKIKLSIRLVGTLVALDSVVATIDEVPSSQRASNDSRAHIAYVYATVSATASLTQYGAVKDTITFERRQLVLEPDEALFLNVVDILGNPPNEILCNIWYED